MSYLKIGPVRLYISRIVKIRLNPIYLNLAMIYNFPKKSPNWILTFDIFILSHLASSLTNSKNNSTSINRKGPLGMIKMEESIPNYHEELLNYMKSVVCVWFLPCFTVKLKPSRIGTTCGLVKPFSYPDISREQPVLFCVRC